MSTHVPGFLSFSGCLCHFVLAKLGTTSIRVNLYSQRPTKKGHSSQQNNDKMVKKDYCYSELYLDKLFLRSSCKAARC